MYGKNIRQLRTRLFIALAIAAIAAIVMAVATLADGETSVGGMIFTLLLALPILFLEFYGLLIAPRLWLDYYKAGFKGVAACFVGMAVGSFFIAIWGILKMMFGGLVCAVKSLAVRAQGTAYVIKNRGMAQ